MATVKGVIFPNRAAFEGKQTAIYNYYVANVPNVNTNVVTKWSDGIDSQDDSKVLMIVDERIINFPWSPEQVVDIDTNDIKWFPQNEL